MSRYVKGYEYSIPKAARVFGMPEEKFPIGNAIQLFQKHVVRSAYFRLELGSRVPGPVKPVFIVVVDEDDVLKDLEERATPDLNPHLEWVMQILEGPFIYDVEAS